MQGLLPLQRYFDFSGRSARAEYWQWILITTIASWIAAIADGSQSTPYSPSFKFSLTLYLGTAIPWLAVGMRRMHDIGKSGWWYGVVWVFATISGALIYIGNAANQRTGDDTVLGIAVAIFLIFLIYAGYVVYLTIKPGDPRWNDYGHPHILTSPDDSTVNVVPQVQQHPFSPAAQQPTSLERDPLEQIERLAKMREAGMLTDEEFQQQKAANLARLS